MKQLIALLALAGAAGLAQAADKPNVLLIMMDDLNANTSVYGGQAKTPNMERLARQGVRFENAYSVVPACNPSRVALLTGQRPETTGQYVNEGNFRNQPGGKDRTTLPQFLRQQGYEAVAAGKIFHHQRGLNDKPQPLSEDNAWDFQPRLPMATPGIEKYRDAEGHAAWLKGNAEYLGIKHGSYVRGAAVWGPIDTPKEETGDFKIASFCADYLSRKKNKPFFLACGLGRPHLPLLAPQEFFDMYPLDQIKLPNSPDNDLDDVPEAARYNWSSGIAAKLREDKQEWRRAFQGYLASASFADAAVGRILDALDKSPDAANTIVLVVGDHGFQIAEKLRIEKFTLWDLGGRTTMIMRAPGLKPGTVVKPPVNFLDVIPTFTALAGLPNPAGIEGHDLTPLMRDPAMAWPHAAVSTYQPGNNSVRRGPWNYIRYKDGSEELYNLERDPQELVNLAAKSRDANAAVIAELQRFLPKEGATQVDFKPSR